MILATVLGDRVAQPVTVTVRRVLSSLSGPVRNVGHFHGPLDFLDLPTVEHSDLPKNTCPRLPRRPNGASTRFRLRLSSGGWEFHRNRISLKFQPKCKHVTSRTLARKSHYATRRNACPYTRAWNSFKSRRFQRSIDGRLCAKERLEKVNCPLSGDGWLMANHDKWKRIILDRLNGYIVLFYSLPTPPRRRLCTIQISVITSCYSDCWLTSPSSAAAVGRKRSEALHLHLLHRRPCSPVWWPCSSWACCCLRCCCH